jgi:hypothetical protein
MHVQAKVLEALVKEFESVRGTEAEYSAPVEEDENEEESDN